MERLYRGFDIIANRVHTSNQQRRNFEPKLWHKAEILKSATRSGETQA